MTEKRHKYSGHSGIAFRPHGIEMMWVMKALLFLHRFCAHGTTHTVISRIRLHKLRVDDYQRVLQ
jgi:hypothetical protein